MSHPPRLRAPREDGAVVAEPPLGRAGELLALNRQRLAAPGVTVLGRPLSDLRRAARETALAAAADYLRRAGEPAPAGAFDSLLLAGHQPELFHPGVWVKHFALNGLARRHGAAPVNLVVDNDTVKSAALAVPVPSDPPHAARVPFDLWTAEVPYEERDVRDEGLFAGFADRARRPWGYRPLLEDFWPEVLRQAARTPLLGERFAAARRAWERRWGCHNFEVPVSAVARTEPFAWFACHVLAELPRFHAIYNACVHEYRRRYGVRSRHHPVPDLAAADGWLEAPFWAWRAGQARRGRLFARPSEGRIELRVGDERWPALPPRSQPAAWPGLERAGLKVRPRALTNTLYARLFLGDLFVHGIGGGKYDELTDAIARRFYGLEPPAFLVLSATLLLPLPAAPASPGERRRLARELRDLQYNPQRHLDADALADPAVRGLVEEKRSWVERRPADRAGRRERFRALRDLTERLRAAVAGQEERVRREWQLQDKGLRANEVLRRRDYAFCLYPEQLLRPFCTRFLEHV